MTKRKTSPKSPVTVHADAEFRILRPLLQVSKDLSHRLRHVFIRIFYENLQPIPILHPRNGRRNGTQHLRLPRKGLFQEPGRLEGGLHHRLPVRMAEQKGEETAKGRVPVLLPAEEF